MRLRLRGTRGRGWSGSRTPADSSPTFTGPAADWPRWASCSTELSSTPSGLRIRGRSRRSLAACAVPRSSGPTPVDEGIRRCRETLERRKDDLKLQAALQDYLAVLLAGQGRFEEARELLGFSQHFWDELGLAGRPSADVRGLRRAAGGRAAARPRRSCAWATPSSSAWASARGSRPPPPCSLERSTSRAS